MDDARRLMLMVCSATGINEPYLTGDPEHRESCDREDHGAPMELQFTARQSLWSSILSNILDYIIDQAADDAVRGRCMRERQSRSTMTVTGL